MTSTRNGVLAAAATLTLILTGCSGDDGASGDTVNGEDTGASAEGPLGGLTGEGLCGMVDPATIEKQFDVNLADQPRAHESESQGEVAVVSCTYSQQPPAETYFSLTTNVSVDASASGAEGALGSRAYDGYEPVEGLGDAAAFSGATKDKTAVVVALDADDTIFLATTTILSEGTLEQLRPIAAELLGDLESTLG